MAEIKSVMPKVIRLSQVHWNADARRYKAFIAPNLPVGVSISNQTPVFVTLNVAHPDCSRFVSSLFVNIGPNSTGAEGPKGIRVHVVMEGRGDKGEVYLGPGAAQLLTVSILLDNAVGYGDPIPGLF